jgi:AcrR family transcriptional regulator
MQIVMAKKGGVREVARRAVRSEIASTAMALFVEQGFEETTVEQIAAAVGMSSRSVFRYFPTKEDMVVGDMMHIGDDLAAALAARPVEESPWDALRRALDRPLEALRDDPKPTLDRCMMFATTPSLRSAQQQKHAQWEKLLVPLVAMRLQGSANTRDLRAHAIVSAALSCLDVAVAEWTRCQGAKPMDDLLDAAIAAVRG